MKVKNLCIWDLSKNLEEPLWRKGNPWVAEVRADGLYVGGQHHPGIEIALLVQAGQSLKGLLFMTRMCVAATGSFA